MADISVMIGCVSRVDVLISQPQQPGESGDRQNFLINRLINKGAVNTKITQMDHSVP